MRLRSRRAAAAVAGLLVLGGCGSGAARHVAQPPPRLPAALAGELAQASDAVAAALESGDGCSALALAQGLQQKTQAAIAAHRVAARLQQPLQATVGDLVRRIQCVPPLDAGSQPQAGDQGRGKDKGKHKGEKKHGGGGD
jgi:hypothetical protein